VGREHPANVAIGAARLGLKSALITRVGDEPTGRFVLEQLAREGVLRGGCRWRRRCARPEAAFAMDQFLAGRIAFLKAKVKSDLTVEIRPAAMYEGVPGH